MGKLELKAACIKKQYNVPVVILQSTNNDKLEVGGKYPIRVNCNVGINNEAGRAYEIGRLDAIKNSEYVPDTFMDLSIGHYAKPFYKEIQERFDCPTGFVPSYLLPTDRAITKHDAVDFIKRLADDGVSFFTLHLTATKELFDLAIKTRKIPVTSRGGSIVIRHFLDTGDENIWLSILPEIITIAKEYNIVISLGTTFRPAGIEEACDEVHVRETEEQLRMCQQLRAEGVQVMVENVGHISLDKLEKHCELLRQFNAPIMPLGPLPTDCAENEDHIASAIGASMMGYWDCAHIINCITRSEHTKSFFSIEETLEAIKTAKLAAHIIDVARGINTEEDNKIFEQRAKQHNCLAGAAKDCSRCAELCPLKLH